jgi:hypothetical protein
MRLCGAVLNLEITAIVKKILMPLFFHQKQKKPRNGIKKRLKKNGLTPVILRQMLFKSTWNRHGNVAHGRRMTAMCDFYGKYYFLY